MFSVFGSAYLVLTNHSKRRVALSCLKGDLSTGLRVWRSRAFCLGRQRLLLIGMIDSRFGDKRLYVAETRTWLLCGRSSTSFHWRITGKAVGPFGGIPLGTFDPLRC